MTASDPIASGPIALVMCENKLFFNLFLFLLLTNRYDKCYALHHNIFAQVSYSLLLSVFPFANVLQKVTEELKFRLHSIVAKIHNCLSDKGISIFHDISKVDKLYQTALFLHQINYELISCVWQYHKSRKRKYFSLI